MGVLDQTKIDVQKLASGVNPLTDESFDNEKVIENNPDLREALEYVSESIVQLEKDNPWLKKNKRRRFWIEQDKLSLYEYSDEPVSLTTILNGLVQLVDKTKVKRFPYSAVARWLVGEGMLDMFERGYGNASFYPTKKGEELGIIAKRRADGKTTLYYTRRAQEYIVNNVPAIIQSRKKRRWKANPQATK
ncbi:MAG: hypothetical protein IKD20_04425 [Clostridia bacterium]|nr:hypothetical protein [Clostridia bacterium]